MEIKKTEIKKIEIKNKHFNGEVKLVNEKTIFKNCTFGTVYFTHRETYSFFPEFHDCSFKELQGDKCDKIYMTFRRTSLPLITGEDLSKIEKTFGSSFKDHQPAIYKKPIGEPFVGHVHTNCGYETNFTGRLCDYNSYYYVRYYKLDAITDYSWLDEGKSERVYGFEPTWLQKYEMKDVKTGEKMIVVQKIIKRRKDDSIVKVLAIPFEDGLITCKISPYYNRYVTYNKFQYIV